MTYVQTRAAAGAPSVESSLRPVAGLVLGSRCSGPVGIKPVLSLRRVRGERRRAASPRAPHHRELPAEALQGVGENRGRCSRADLREPKPAAPSSLS